MPYRQFRPEAPTASARLITPRSLAVYTIIILAVLLGDLSILYTSLVRVREHEAALDRSHEVLVALDHTQSDMKDAETGMRGFVVTANEAFLEPFNEGKRAVEGDLQRVKVFYSGGSEQQRTFDELRTAVSAILAWHADVIAAVRAIGPGGDLHTARDMVVAGQGKLLMDRIRSLCGDLQAAETKLLGERTVEAQSSDRWLDLSLLAAAFICVLLVILAHYHIRRSLMQQVSEAKRLAAGAWQKNGVSQLAEALLGEGTVAAVSRGALEFFARYVGAQVGALYVLDHGSLALAGVFARSGKTDGAAPRLAMSETLMGEAIKHGKVVEITDIPESYVKVSSALGEARPKSIIVLPLRSAGESVGAVELGFLHVLPESATQLFEELVGILGAAVFLAQARAVQHDLLEESQRLAEALAAQQEELRASNDELEARAAKLRTTQEHLEVQQEELRQTNEDLEQQAKAVEVQTDALTMRNEDLALAKTALEAKAREAEQASRYKSEFLANMSHELRTPLNSLLLLATLLAENQDHTLTEKQIDFARTIFKSGNDLLALINDILDLSKVESGKVDLAFELIDMREFTGGLTSAFRHAAEDKGLAFQVVLQDSVPGFVRSDRQRLEQILKNLLSNAIKFTAKGSVTVVVTMDRSAGPGAFEFCVRDTGIGIANDQHGLIFEAFHQGDGSTSRAFGGTGLGLTISRELAHLLGGTIRVESTPGVGSAFVLRLPEAAPQQPAELTPRFADQAPRVSDQAPHLAVLKDKPVDVAAVEQEMNLSPTDRLVLVVEDDATFGKILVELAREAGFKAALVATGEAGLQFVKRHPVRAVLLDLKLPDMNGLSVLERLKADPASRHIPIHVVSGVNHSQNALSLGAIGYLLKPARRQELQAVFARIEGVLATKVRRVLVVEDDKLQRLAIRDLIGGSDIHIDEAATGAEAKVKLRGEPYDCMVLDLQLPDTSGFELLEELQALVRGQKPPVIVYTAKDLSRDERAKLERYTESVIIKGGLSPERLLDEVSLFLHRLETSLPPRSQALLQKVREGAKGLAGRRILVVDDDMRNVFALVNALECSGVKSVVARNGREALTQLDKDLDIELVLMDIMMPEMDGYEAMACIRRDSRFKKLPVIALTAKAMKGDLEKCLAAGANDYLPKPVILERLLSLLNVWLPKRV